MKTSTVPYSCEPADLNMLNAFLDLRIRLFAHSVCANFSLIAHSVCANFGLIAHSPVYSVIYFWEWKCLFAHSVCANFGLNAHSPSYSITLLK